MTVIKLPMFASARDLADDLVQESVTSTTTSVSVDGRDLDTSTDSFAEELTEQLSERHVRTVKLIGGGKDWHDRVAKYAQRFNLTIEVQGLHRV